MTPIVSVQANLELVEQSTALLATVAYSHKCDVEFRAAHVRDVRVYCIPALSSHPLCCILHG